VVAPSHSSCKDSLHATRKTKRAIYPYRALGYGSYQHAGNEEYPAWHDRS